MGRFGRDRAHPALRTHPLNPDLFLNHGSQQQREAQESARMTGTKLQIRSEEYGCLIGHYPGHSYVQGCAKTEMCLVLRYFLAEQSHGSRRLAATGKPPK